MWLLGVHLLNEKGTRVDESVYAEVEFLREIMVQKQDEVGLISLRHVMLTSEFPSARDHTQGNRCATHSLGTTSRCVR